MGLELAAAQSPEPGEKQAGVELQAVPFPLGPAPTTPPWALQMGVGGVCCSTAHHTPALCWAA